MNSYLHSVSASRKWGGAPEDYMEINTFIDSSKQVIGDVRHRSIYHHTLGIFLCEKIFGTTIKIQKERNSIEVPVRLIAEKHVLEDLGWIPSPADYIKGMPISPWMSGSVKKELPISHILGAQV